MYKSLDLVMLPLWERINMNIVEAEEATLREARTCGDKKQEGHLYGFKSFP
jgi:hypothetical protein